MLALAAGAALAATVALVVVLLTRDPEAPRLRSDELSAEALIDSMGVNVHFTYTDTAYARQAELMARLRELGIHHVRDAMPSPVDSPLAAGLRAASTQGIHATLLPHDPTSDPGPLIADSRAVLGDSIAAFEGPNEPDNGGDPAWADKLLVYMPMLRDRVASQAPGVPLIGPSLVYPASRAQVQGRVPGLSNLHPYSGGGPPEPALGDALRELEGLRRRAPKPGVVFTEAGYHNAMNATGNQQPPASEEAAAVYMPRLFVDAFGAGVRRTFLYELVDEKPEPGLADQEQHFGLLRNDLSPKPAFNAVRTLVAALKASPGPSSSDRVPWDIVPDEPAEVQRLVLARRDGSRVIALWRPVSVWDQNTRQPIDPGRVPVALSFHGAGARDVTVWRPSVSADPVERHASVRRLPLELAGDLVLVSFR
ncbi:MAG: hypothetical protein QOD71_3355 [Thermoleophilaceae bacterium]|jgi:hypothetical protein|nr:hypothetical protein [Thermoleophilaceae bacterium]